MPKAGSRGRKKRLLNLAEEALGRGRGGFSTKVHLACGSRGRPLSVSVTAGQRNEAPELEALLDGIRVARTARAPGRPRTSSPNARTSRSTARGSGRPLSFDAEAYRRRNVVERRVSRFKQWRSVAARYEKWATNYRAMVIIAAMMIWLTS